MSEEARVWAKRQEAPCATSKVVLLEMAAMANTDGECWPGIKYLATVLQKSERQVQRSIARLKEAGLIMADARHQDNGRQTSNLYRLALSEAYTYDPARYGHSDDRRTFSKAEGDAHVTPQDDTHVTPPVTPMSPLEVETLKQETSNEVSLADSDIQQGFDEFWGAYPHKVEERGARAIFGRLIRKREVTIRELVDGARAYAVAVGGREARHIKHPTTWLTRGCWSDAASRRTSPATGSTAAPPSFAGPYDVWLEIARRKGSAWTVSWIDPCGWDDERRAILPRTSFAAGRLADEIGPVLRDLGITLEIPARGAA